MSETPPQQEPEPRARRRWPRIVGWTSLGVIVLVGLAVTWLFTADLGVLKPQIERFVTAQTGRAFHIDGELDIEIGNLTRIRAEQVRFANAAWADEAMMVEIGLFEFHFDLWSLFRDTFVIESINLVGTRIHLVTLEDGDANWRLEMERAADTDTKSGDFQFHIKLIDIDRVDLFFDSPRRSEPLAVRFERIDQSLRADDFLELSVDGTVNGRQVAVSGQTGTWANLLAGVDVEYDFEGSLDTVQLASSGTIDYLVQPHRPELRFSVEGPEIDDLTTMFGVGIEGVGDIDLRGSLVPQVDGPVVLDVNGNVGESEIEVQGRFSDLSDHSQMDLDVLAQGPDLSRILRWFGIDQVREGPYMIDVDARRDGATLSVDRARMVFGQAQFDLAAAVPNFPTLDDASVSLDINGPDIERFRYVFDLPGSATGAFSLSAGLDVSPTGEESIRLTLDNSLGEIRANGTLGPAPDYVGTRLQVHATVHSLAESLAAFGEMVLPDQRTEISGEIELTADGIRTVGPITARVGDDLAVADGTIVPARGLIGTDVRFELTGQDLAARVGGFGPNQGVPVQPYALNGRLRIRDDGQHFEDVSGTLGTSRVEIDGLLVPRSWIVGSRFDVKASGEAFEELFNALPAIDVVPGSYDLSGRVVFEDGLLVLQDLALARERGELGGDFNLGLPVSRNYADFDLSGRGRDIRNIVKNIGPFEFDETSFSIAASGNWQSGAWSLDKLDFSVGAAETHWRGEIYIGDEAASTDFVFEGTVPSLARLGTIDGYRMRDMPLGWSGHVTGSDEMLQIDELVAHLGDSDIRGRINFQLGDVPKLEVDVFSDSIVVVSLMEPREENYDPEPEYPDGRLIPDIAVPFDKMREMDMSLDIDIGAFKRDNLDLTDIGIAVNLQDGVLDVPEFGFNARAGRFDARARLDPGDGVGTVRLQIVARDFALGITEKNQDLATTSDIDVNLDSTGNDLRTLAANADGVMMLHMRGGRIVNNRFMQKIYGDLLQEILGTINPFVRTDPVTNLDCVVLPYSITDGLTRGAPNGFVRTDKIQIATQGTVNLKTERIDINVRTTPRRGMTISAGELVNPFVKIVGTLARPRIAVDEQGVLITGGAAVATGGLTILARAVWDRLSRSKDPCGEVSRQAHEKLSDRFPDWADEITVDSAVRE